MPNEEILLIPRLEPIIDVVMRVGCFRWHGLVQRRDANNVVPGCVILRWFRVKD